MANDRSKSLFPTVVGGLVIIIIVVVVAILIHNDHSKVITAPAGITVTQKADAVQKIKNNWTIFFAADTPMGTRESLLQNGSAFVQPMQAEFSALSHQASSVSISGIEVDSAGTSATVKYTVNLGGRPVLSDQTGTAVLVHNNWLVSSSTLCDLLRLGGTQLPVCKNQ